MIFDFLKRNYSNASVENDEKSVSDFIPYSHHYDDNTILTKTGDLVSVIKVNGFSFETADGELVESKKQGRNNLLKGMANEHFSVYFHTIRKKYSVFPSGEFEDGFPKLMNEQWKSKHDPNHTFINEHYISIVRKNNAKTAILASLSNALHSGQKNKDAAMMDMFSEFEEMRDRLVNGMAAYKTKLLGIRRTPTGNFSEVAEFFGFIVNVGYKQNMLLPRVSMDKYICNNRLFFGSGSMEVIGPGYRKYAGVVSIKEYRPATYAGIMDGFLHLPYEFVISQSFNFTDRMSAISKMQLQQRRLVQSADVAISQVQEINDALDAAMGGEFAFGTHHLTIMCMHDTKKGLDNVLSQAVVEFANSGVSAVREKMNMELAFWAQLPANDHYAARKATINSLNLASYASLHNYPSGKAAKNFWGDAVTVLNTTSGTPYFFSFHIRDVGHTMIIGPTGAGKTVLLNFLACQAQKFKPRTFFFDKDRGAEIFIRSIDGEYIIIDPGKPCGFNPLQMEDTPSNRNFLVEWLTALVSTNGETVTADDVSRINTAIIGNFKLKREDRRLSNIAPFFGINTPGSLAGRLSKWHSNGAKAKIFDNPEDLIDFSRGRIFGFEMAEILKDKAVIGPVLLYIFERINAALDGTPTMVVLDEAWALIDNPVFAPKIKDWLKVMRKLNAFVVFATQSVEDASKSEISDTLVQQTATQIFLPNLKATYAYREVFMLSEREFLIVKNTDPSSRFFLIKQDGDGVVARLDLGGLPDAINILSGRVDTVVLLTEIRKQLGSDPRQWLPVFLREVRNY